MKKVAIVIGHNAKSKGAYSPILGYEFDYWKKVAEKIKVKIPELVDIYERKYHKFYGQEMRELTSRTNKENYTFLLELHFNSSLSRAAKGCECLVYYKNDKAKELATNFLARVQNQFGSTIRGNRGLILISDKNVRGAMGILNSKDTYILTEAFFGSNEEEALKFSGIEKVADLYVDFIKENI